jgi:hypothetical protein
MSALNDFRSHVERYDLAAVFDLANRAGNAVQVRNEIEAKACDLYRPYEAALDADGGWIAARWKGSEKRGFTWTCNGAAAPLGNARTPLDLDPMQVSLAAFPQGIYEALVTLSSGRGDSSGWHIESRGGWGIKTILGEMDWERIEADPAQLQQQLNDALAQIANFDPNNLSAKDYFQCLFAANGWVFSYPDMTVPFHLVWPQYYPVWYGGMNQPDRSHIHGIHKLLDELSRELNLPRRQLADLSRNYDDYAAAYRVLLLAYHAFMSDPRSGHLHPHFDYLTGLSDRVAPSSRSPSGCP